MAPGRGRWWRLLPRPVREFPFDLAIVLVLTALTIVVVISPALNETPLRVVIGLPFVLFLPGYAFIAALFPEAGTSPTEGGEQSEETDAEGFGRYLDRGIDGLERVALSFGLSIAIVPLIGLVLNFTPWGIRLVPILASVSAFTVVATVVAARRRWDLPEEERFRVPYRSWFARGRAELLEPDSRTDAALNVLLVVSLLLAMASVTYAVTVPKQGETFTEFYLLTEDDDGDLVAADFPTEYRLGERKPVVIGVSNREHRPTDYTVVVTLQDVEFENNSTTVLRQRELSRHRLSLAHNETWHYNYSVRPTMTGTRLRLAFLLYRGDAPESPSVESAYRETHLWVNVSNPE